MELEAPDLDSGYSLSKNSILRCQSYPHAWIWRGPPAEVQPCF